MRVRAWAPTASNRRVVLWFLSPWLVGAAVFVAYPIGASLYYSFTRYDIVGSPHWVGLANYRSMFLHDPVFRIAARNTLWLVLVGLPIQLAFALATALLLARPRRGTGLLRTIVYLPSMVPAVAATLAFVFLLRPGSGPLDRLLGALHLGQPLWFQDPRFAKPALLILGLWGIGPTVIVYVAGLVSVPNVLHEMALVENAGRWARFRHVTLPSLLPVIVFTSVIGIINAFQYFTQAYVAGGASAPSSPILGAPQQSTLFYSLWLYAQGFRDFRMGYASAMAWVLLLATLLCSVAILRWARRFVALEDAK